MEKNFLLLAGFVLLSLQCFSQTPSARDKKVAELLSKMTVEEKAGQLNIIVGETIVTGPTFYTRPSDKFDDLIKSGKITGLFNVHGAEYTARLQKIAVEQSRLKIPLLFGADVIHGFKTVTPLPLAEAASWDMKAIQASAAVAAREASAAGINFNFAPMVDVSRDPRWGRISEGAGEDPFLGSAIAVARVKGFQGEKLGQPGTLAACVKHFAAYGASEAGRDYNTTDVSERSLKEMYLKPYKAAIDAGAATVMTSFNELDGVPVTAHKGLLQDILRNEWKFDGLVVSDYGSINELMPHGIAENQVEATKLALEAGTDMDMMSYAYIQQIPKMVADGKLDIKTVDDAVRRVLELKYDLGLFDNPYLYSDVAREKKEIRSKQNLDIARDMARKSMVLLKNENQLLPLKASYKSIAVIGPLADNKEEMNGSWSFFGEPTDPITILQGIKERAPKDTKILYAQGCNLFDNATDKFEEAVNVASQAEVVLVAVGESAVMNGEGASRAEIGLPGVQQELLEKIAATGKPVVVLLLNGRPLTIEWMDQNIPAILDTWTLGSEAGHAVADVVFGDYNPSGKLPATFPRTVGQVPIYYNHKNTGRPYHGDYKEPLSQRVYQSKYRDVQNSPLYPFGYGLSYTTFDYSEITLNKEEIDFNGKLEANVTVTNKGSVAGEEVVQLYIRDLVGSVTRPVKELKGFQKIMLKPGESAKVSFTLTAEDLAFYKADMSWGAEPGAFDIFIGTNSRDVKKKSFRLVATMNTEVGGAYSK